MTHIISDEDFRHLQQYKKQLAEQEQIRKEREEQYSKLVQKKLAQINDAKRNSVAIILKRRLGNGCMQTVCVSFEEAIQRINQSCFGWEIEPVSERYFTNTSVEDLLAFKKRGFVISDEMIDNARKIRLSNLDLDIARSNKLITTLIEEKKSKISDVVRQYDRKINEERKWIAKFEETRLEIEHLQ